jgi:hypothetical protein
MQREARLRMFRRRRRVALGGLAAIALLLGLGAALLFGGGGGGGNGASTPRELPRGGREILPRYRVVAYYGAPQDPELGILGIGSPAAAGRKLLQQSRRYARRRRPMMPALELIATVARKGPGPDGKHRLRQSGDVIRRYLEAARRIKGLLILDVQPGQSGFPEEVKVLEPYLKEPDVGLALDSEWSVAPPTVPGKTIGSTDAATINRVSSYLADIVRRGRLPQKLLIVHQFTAGMVKDRALVANRPGLAIVYNVDGFGAPAVKIGAYKHLAVSHAPAGGPRFFNGLKLFFREDTALLAPEAVLGLRSQTGPGRVRIVAAPRLSTLPPR